MGGFEVEFASGSVGHGPPFGGADQAGVLGQGSGWITGRMRLPSGFPLGQGLIVNHDIEGACGEVDPNPVPLFHQTERAADLRLWRHVAYAKSRGPTRETAIGDEQELPFQDPPP